MAGLEGQSLGRYHILEQLGEGGMATVYKAYDTRLEREVAVKVIRTDLFGPSVLERMLKRFEREAKALARLSHPHIIKVIDYGEHNGSPYLVMEYLPGGTLKQRLGQPMRWQDAIRLLLPLAQALESAHESGLVHRDVKPSNILLTNKGQPMLTDFGIAKILENEDATALTGTGMGVGTPEYMAPEQWTGQASPQSDIYSLGVVFYEMVTGRKPYSADTPAAILLKQATEPLPRPSLHAPGLPDVVERVLVKALARQPEDRYTGMGDLARALESALAGPPATDPNATRDELPAPTRHTPPATKAKTRPAPKPAAWLAKYWPLAAMALLLGLGLALGGGLLQLGAQGSGPLAALATTTASPTHTPSPTASLTPSRTPVPSQTPTATPTATATLAPGATRVREADGMVMVYVPAGPFEMGSNNGDSDERPVHTVTLDAFWIDQTEVTNAMYALCVGAGACREPAQTNAYRNTSRANHPVVYVNWQQASDYCAWADTRLPTEAEWEKAARGSDGHTYPWGNNNPTCRLANYRGCVSSTVPVGSYPTGASPYGALDMAGNVWEWVSDWYDANYYSNVPAENPTGPTSGQSRVLRGGSWINIDDDIRSAVRNGNYPVNSNSLVGFRCLRSP